MSKAIPAFVAMAFLVVVVPSSSHFKMHDIDSAVRDTQKKDNHTTGNKTDSVVVNSRGPAPRENEAEDVGIMALRLLLFCCIAVMVFLVGLGFHKLRTGGRALTCKMSTDDFTNL